MPTPAQLGEILSLPFVLPLFLGVAILSVALAMWFVYTDVADGTDQDFAWGLIIGVLLVVGIVPGVLAFVYYIWTREPQGRDLSE